MIYLIIKPNVWLSNMITNEKLFDSSAPWSLSSGVSPVSRLKPTYLGVSNKICLFVPYQSLIALQSLPNEAVARSNLGPDWTAQFEKAHSDQLRHAGFLLRHIFWSKEELSIPSAPPRQLLLHRRKGCATPLISVKVDKRTS